MSSILGRLIPRVKVWKQGGDSGLCPQEAPTSSEQVRYISSDPHVCFGGEAGWGRNSVIWLVVSPASGWHPPRAISSPQLILLRLNSCPPVSATLGAAPLCRTPAFGEVGLKRRSALPSSALQRTAKAFSSSWQGDSAAF